MEDNTQLKKNFIWNTLGTGINAFNSLFFMIIVTRINGVDEAGIFTIAFSTACILYSIGLYAGRIYQVTELNKKITDKDFIASKIITSIAMIVFVLGFCFLKGYNKQKSVIFLLLTLMKVIEAFADTIHGILQKNEKLDIVGKSLLMRSLLAIIIFLIIDVLTKNMIISILAMLVIYIIIVTLYDIRNAKNYIDFKNKVSFESIIDIFKNGFFIFAISFLGMYVLNAPKYAIDTYLTENYQTIFGIIVMPATIVGLVAQFLIHPYLNEIVKLYEEKDLTALNKLLLKIIKIIMGVGLLATILGYLLGTQVLGIIYNLNLSEYKIELAIIIIAATVYTIGTIYSSVLTTVRETFSQFVIYVILTIITFVFSNLFTKAFGIKGAVIAYFLIMMAQATLYFIYTKIKLKKIFEK